MESEFDRWKTKTKPLPDEVVLLDYFRTFSETEYEKLLAGLIPEAMEDKWFCYVADRTLYLHRSWTGHCIYRVELEEFGGGYRTTRASANRHPEQYTEKDDRYDADLLDFLISNLLLGEEKTFPKPSDLAEAVPGVLQHHMSGTGYSEKPCKKKSWWRFWE